MLFCEHIAALRPSVRLQVFASDADGGAVESARRGLYRDTIEADVSEARLARFFCHDEHGYCIQPELRALVVFTVQDVLAYPPFSRLDFISCRNLLIYLQRDAQARVISLFDFALREGGFLLLGAAETPRRGEGRFETIAKAERLYRRVGQSRPAGLRFLTGAAGRGPAAGQSGREDPPEVALAALGQRLVLDSYAPAAILINSRRECLYTLGPIDRYLRVAAGGAAQDVLALARDGVRTRLRTALYKADLANGALPRARVPGAGVAVPYSIEVRPLDGPGEATHLICFIEQPELHDIADLASFGTAPRATDLEHEVEVLRAELAEAGRCAEAAGEEQRALDEEALSVNEEHQSANEELLTSKEELQSLNEELTALNSQLQETLERQRTTSNDMQNVLNSTEVATLFLDRHLNIRFFTPKTRMLFNLIAADIGRPLTDLVSLASDAALPDDARAVLRNEEPLEKEIEAKEMWFMRRVLPYRTDHRQVDGVVITFTDITERKFTARALEDAREEAERANAAKSRFLAAASHDLRQPLQTLALLQGLLAKAVEGHAAADLVARLDATLGAMSGMLDSVLDINQIEAGVIGAEIVAFPVSGLLARLHDEYSYQAHAQSLGWSVVPCSLNVVSDPRLLEQMLRNLVSNALKYTGQGKVLLGCRRRGASLTFEVWDTGTGIPEDKLGLIFEEYHQLDNAARDRGKGLGLGLSIVRRLGNLLDHRVGVQSRQGRGSVFTIEVPLARDGAAPHDASPELVDGPPSARALSRGSILVVEDDPDVRELLQLFLRNEGHRVSAAADGASALNLVVASENPPDVLLTDYNLPGGLNGLELAGRLREGRRRPLPVVVLTGDISAEALRAIAQHDCVPLNKPVRLDGLTSVLYELLSPSPDTTAPEPAKRTLADAPIIFIVDDDPNIRRAIRGVLEADGREVEDHASSESFLLAYQPCSNGCLLIDAHLPGLGGLDLLRRLRRMDDRIPAIIITGHGDVHMAVQAMQAGASDFLEKPISPAELGASLERALEQSTDSGKLSSWRATAARAARSLTDRQRQVMALVIAGHPSKNIAADLGISQRTVENHRAAIMERTGCTSLPALARLALAAAWTGSDESLVAAGPIARTARP